MKGFLDFVRTQGVVGLAVGFILGGAVSDLVKSFINNIVNPLLGILLNKASGISEATFTFLGATFTYGVFITALVNFAVVALVVYIGVKKLGLDKLDKKE
jgi:large conductance mechanosensitive channel